MTNAKVEPPSQSKSVLDMAMSLVTSFITLCSPQLAQPFVVHVKREIRECSQSRVHVSIVDSDVTRVYLPCLVFHGMMIDEVGLTFSVNNNNEWFT